MPKTTAKKLTHSEYADAFDMFPVMNNVVRGHAELLIGRIQVAQNSNGIELAVSRLFLGMK